MASRFHHILVPLDFTDENQKGLDAAFEIALQKKSRVTLLHVIETIEGADDDEMRSFFKRLQRRAETELDKRTQPFAQAGVAVDRQIRFGRRTAEIVQDAAERQVDLIVMSSHPIDPARPVQSWGTVSYQVSVLCHCPVLLIK